MKEIPAPDKKCRECLESMAAGATRCPHCGSWVKAKWRAKDTAGLLIVLAVVALLLVVLAVVNSCRSTAKSRQMMQDIERDSRRNSDRYP